MELDVILAAVKQFKEMGLSHVSLTGGEIFLYPKLKELIIALKKFNLSITLLTNATMIKAEWIDFFKKQEIQEIQISIYGAEENIYNTVTNTTGIFRNHLESLERLGESGIPVTCSLIMMRENFENRNAITHGDGSFVLTSALIYAKV